MSPEITPQETIQPLFDPARAAALMEEARMDLLLASRRHNVAYLTGQFSLLLWEYPEVAHCLEREDDGCEAPYYFAGLPAEPSQPAFVVAHENRAGIWRGRSWIDDVKDCCDRPGKLPATECLAAAIEERGLGGGRIGVEFNHLPMGTFMALQSRFPEATWCDATGTLWRMRQVKTERELARQRQAYRLAEKVYQEVFALLAQAPTVSQVRELEMQRALEAGCPPLHFGYVAPVYRPGGEVSKDLSYRIQPGDVVLLDLGLVHRGYTTDFGRMVSVGPPDDATRAGYDLVRRARERVQAAIGPGVKACEAYRAGQDYLLSVGHSLPYLGHGLGIECHEPPVLAPDDETILEEGMTVVIEISLAPSGIWMLLEDAGVITSDGWESLTCLDPDWVELT